MRRKAIVADIDESCVHVLILDEVEKVSDKACGRTISCGSTSCGCRVSGRPFKAAIPKRILVKPGDTVEVSASVGLGALLLVLGVPSATAVAGWLLLTKNFSQATEGYSALGAVVGFLIASGLVFMIGSCNKAKRLPEIIAVVHEGTMG